MKIGEHEVTQVTRKSAKVGCQVVKREEVEKLLQSMNEAPDVQLSINQSKTVDGSVWLSMRESGDTIELRMYSNGSEWVLLELNPRGFRRVGFCKGSKLPVEGDTDLVTLIGEF